MKEDKKELKIKGIGNSFIRTCPVCGYSFRIYNPKTKKKISICPMCGHKFIDPDVFPNTNNNIKKRFF
jgi:rubrerythrin